MDTNKLIEGLNSASEKNDYIKGLKKDELEALVENLDIDAIKNLLTKLNQNNINILIFVMINKNKLEYLISELDIDQIMSLFTKLSGQLQIYFIKNIVPAKLNDFLKKLNEQTQKKIYQILTFEQLECIYKEFRTENDRKTFLQDLDIIQQAKLYPILEDEIKNYLIDEKKKDYHKLVEFYRILRGENNPRNIASVKDLFARLDFNLLLIIYTLIEPKEQFILFYSLDENQKLKLYSEMTLEQQKRLYIELKDTERINLHNKLNPTLRSNLYSTMSLEELMEIYKLTNTSDKKRESYIGNEQLYDVYQRLTNGTDNPQTSYVDKLKLADKPKKLVEQFQGLSPKSYQSFLSRLDNSKIKEMLFLLDVNKAEDADVIKNILVSLTTAQLEGIYNSLDDAGKTKLGNLAAHVKDQLSTENKNIEEFIGHAYIIRDNLAPQLKKVHKDYRDATRLAIKKEKNLSALQKIVERIKKELAGTPITDEDKLSKEEEEAIKEAAKDKATLQNMLTVYETAIKGTFKYMKDGQEETVSTDLVNEITENKKALFKISAKFQMLRYQYVQMTAQADMKTRIALENSNAISRLNQIQEETRTFNKTEEDHESSYISERGYTPVVYDEKKVMIVDPQKMVADLSDYIYNLQENKIITLSPDKTGRSFKGGKYSPKFGNVILDKECFGLIKSCFDHMMAVYEKDNKEERKPFVRRKTPNNTSGGYISILVLLSVILLSSLIFMLIIK